MNFLPFLDVEYLSIPTKSAGSCQRIYRFNNIDNSECNNNKHETMLRLKLAKQTANQTHLTDEIRRNLKFVFFYRVLCKKNDSAIKQTQHVLHKVSFFVSISLRRFLFCTLLHHFYLQRPINLEKCSFTVQSCALFCTFFFC